MVDLAKNEEDRQLIYLFSQPDDIGRSVIAPPGVAPELVAQLRRGFLAAVNDATVQTEAAQAHLGLDPKTGEEMQKLLVDSGSVPDVIVKRARAIAAIK
jgi:tripartite-type tricarboxylate transporter receptor subunit TctC